MFLFALFRRASSRRLIILCAVASEAIDRIGSGDGAGAVNLLQNALSEAEDLYICAEDERKKE